MSRLDGVVGLVVVLPFVMGAATAPTSTERELFSFADREIDEASGLAVVDGLFVTVNDSGDEGRVFTVDPATGETVGTTRWDREPVDDEALAPAPDGDVWVADIGDNLAGRDEVEVRKVPVGRGDRTATPTTYRLRYPDGPRDAETLLCDPTTGRLYVASKSLFGGTLYAAPAELGPGVNQLEPVGDVLGVATDGAFFPDGRHLVLRDYGRAVVYAMPSLEQVATFALPAQEQGEAVAVDDRDRVWVTSEGVGAAVLGVDLPADVGTAVAAVATGTSGTAGTAGTAGATPAPPTPSSTHPPTRSREDRELPEATTQQRSAWPWFLSGWIAVGFLVLLLRSMRKPTKR